MQADTGRVVKLGFSVPGCWPGGLIGECPIRPRGGFILIDRGSSDLTSFVMFTSRASCNLFCNITLRMQVPEIFHDLSCAHLIHHCRRDLIHCSFSLARIPQGKCKVGKFAASVEGGL
jgi:hypothetical protein